MSSNQIDLEARKLTYSQFPNKYVYNKSKRKWKKRKRRFSIGRMTHVSISTGELYYLHVLLTHVKGPTCFDDIKTVNGVVHLTFRDACFAMGLLDDDKEFIDTIKEAAHWASGNLLSLFSFQCSYAIHLIDHTLFGSLQSYLYLMICSIYPWQKCLDHDQMVTTLLM